MNTLQRKTISAVAVALLLGLGGCSGMSERNQDTALGAGAGGIAGGVLTGGSTLGVLGGAAVGGLIGRAVGEESEKR